MKSTPSVTRRGLRLATMLVVAGLLASGCGGDSDDDADGAATTSPPPEPASDLEIPDEPDDVTVLTSFFLHNGGWTPLFAGKEAGIFEDYGIDLTIELGRGSSDVATQLAGGAADFGMVDMLAGVQAIGQGAEITFVSTYYQRYIGGLCTNPDNVTIESFDDLEGLRVGASAGDAFQSILPALTDASYEHVVIEPAAYLGALSSDQVDAITISQNNVLRRQQELSNQGAELDCFMYGEHGVELAGEGIAARSGLLEESPELVQRFVTALAEATIWTLENREEAVDLYAGVTDEITDADLELETFESMIPYYHDDTTGDEWFVTSPERVQESIDIAGEFFDTPALEASEVFTDEFTDAIPEELRAFEAS